MGKFEVGEIYFDSEMNFYFKVLEMLGDNFSALIITGDFSGYEVTLDSNSCQISSRKATEQERLLYV